MADQRNVPEVLCQCNSLAAPIGDPSNTPSHVKSTTTAGQCNDGSAQPARYGI